MVHGIAFVLASILHELRLFTWTKEVIKNSEGVLYEQIQKICG